jgi:protein phosphatase
MLNLSAFNGPVPDSVWIAVVAVLVFVLVYGWVSGPPAEEPSEKPRAAKEKTKKKKEPKDKAADAPAKAKVEAAPEKAPASTKPASSDLPRLATAEEEEDEEVDPTKVGSLAKGSNIPIQPPTQTIVADKEAAVDEPTHGGALILVTGIAQTDKGLRRKRNEDSILALPLHGVYVVADGMGGYRGGEIASALAVKSLEHAFERQQFDGLPHEKIPKRASELARAIQMANDAVLRRAEHDAQLKGMGTTICAARFSSNKQRLYVGHVGDSRMYRLRDGKLAQLTSDHTMKDLGVTGDAAAHLSRAVGIWPTVPIDMILCKPRPRDLYLMCSDGLNKMLPDTMIADILGSSQAPPSLADELINAANARGGKDNISVVVIRVDDPVTSGAAAS